VCKRAHGADDRNAFRFVWQPLRPFSRLINRDRQAFRRIALRVLVLDQRENCPLDAPQASAHSELSILTGDAGVNIYSR
jgi:hypothetical protein